MNKELIPKLQYTHIGQEEAHSLPLPLIESLELISDFFCNSSNHKLCLVFPTKEFAAQWLSIPVYSGEVDPPVPGQADPSVRGLLVVV